MTGRYYSHLNPKCEARPIGKKMGCGVFAREHISKGELVSLWGGQVVAQDELDPTMPNFTQRILQLDEALYLQSPESLEPSDCFNHSCEPNLGFTGQIGLISMREIQAGEELTFDYAMCDGTPYDQFECSCGSAACRRRVTGNDWKMPELWRTYDGYFSPYLARRIAKLKSGYGV